MYNRKDVFPVGLFGNYMNPGPGINTNAPKKKPFFRFWDVLRHNSGRLLMLNLIITALHLPLLLSMVFYVQTDNALTVPFSIFLLVLQVILEGPVLAGCARVLRMIVLDKACFLGEEFRKGFFGNFFPALLYWLLDTVIIVSTWLAWQLYPQYAEENGIWYVLLAVTLGVALMVLFMNFYVFPLQVATTLQKKSVIKNSFMLAAISPKQCLLTLGCIVLTLAFCLGLMCITTYLMFLFAFFPAAFIGYLVMFINYPVIQKYVINPYYADTGEENPEAEPAEDSGERVFTDRGGSEEPAPKNAGKKGKVIS